LLSAGIKLTASTALFLRCGVIASCNEPRQETK